jgi:hypothetical protein
MPGQFLDLSFMTAGKLLDIPGRVAFGILIGHRRASSGFVARILGRGLPLILLGRRRGRARVTVGLPAWSRWLSRGRVRRLTGRGFAPVTRHQPGPGDDDPADLAVGSLRSGLAVRIFPVVPRRHPPFNHVARGRPGGSHVDAPTQPARAAVQFGQDREQMLAYFGSPAYAHLQGGPANPEVILHAAD